MYHPSYESLDVSTVQMDSAGLRLLRDPQTNRGMRLSKDERIAMGVHGMLPPVVFSVETDLARVRFQLDRIEKPLDKYSYLMGLQDRDEQIFYKFVMDNVTEAMPYLCMAPFPIICNSVRRLACTHACVHTA